MSFTWSETGKGKLIKALHLTELHDNIDSIKDNEACISDKSSDYTPHDATANSPDYVTNDSSDYSSNDGSHNSGVLSYNKESYYSPDDLSVDSSQYTGVNTSYDDSYHNVYESLIG